jgi:hypothetical protein
MLILKQNAANTVPTPPAGKGTIFLDDSDTLSVKTSDGNVETFPTVAASNAQVVFMNGTSLSGEAALTYDFNNNVLNVSGNVAAGNVKTDNLLYANGTAWDLSDPGGSNTQIQFNDDESFGGSAAFTFNKSSNLVTVGANLNANNINVTTHITSGNVWANSGTIGALTLKGEGGNISNIAGGNVTGQVGNALVAGTVYTAAQPNITSVGTLTSLAVTGNTSSGNFNTAGKVVASTFESNVADGTAPMVVVSTTKVANLNADLLDGYSTATAATANTVVIRDADGSFSANVVTANLSGNATTAGTVVTAAQPNITSVGTLSSLVVSGNANVANLNATGHLLPTAGNTYDLGSESAPWRDLWVSGSSIRIGGARITANATSLVLQNPQGGQVVVAGNSVASSTSIVSGTSNVSIPTADGNVNTSVGGTANVLVVTGTGANVTGTLNATGNANVGNLGTGGLITATGNVSGGNLTTAGVVAATGNVSGGNLTTGGALSVTGNANVGNLGTAGLIVATGNVSGGNLTTTGVVAATGNVTTAAQLVSSVSTGTAPLVITSTTRVANLDVAKAGIANTVNDAAQPNITSVGTLTSLGVSGTITAANITANTGVFTGNGSGLTDIAGANVTGQTGNALVAGTVYTNAQPNITSVGTLTSLAVTGNATAGNVYANAGTIGASLLTGTLTTASQPNITSVGTLSSLTTTGNVAAGNLTTTGILSVTGTGVSSIAGNLDMTSNNIINLAAPVNASDAATKQYVDDVAQGLNVHDSCAAATPDTLANITSGTITYNNGTAGVGAYLTTSGTFNLIDGVNVQTAGTRILVKNEANAVLNGIYTYTNTTAITRAVDFDSIPEVEAGDFTFITGGTLYDNTGWVQTESPTGIGTAGNNISFTQFSGAGTYNAGTGLTLTGSTFSVNASQTQITSVGTLTSLGVSGTITAANITANTGVFTGNGSGLTALAGGNVTGQVANALVAGTVYTAAQPNITSVGTLSSLSVTGNVSAGNVSGTLLTGTLATAAQPNVTSLGTLTGLGVNGTITGVNITANTGVFTGNGSGLTALAGGNVTGQVANALVAGTVYTAAQPNITSVGTLTGLGVNGNITAANITANTGVFTGNGSGLSALAGANVTGTVSSATTAGTVTTAAQPNITSVGTLTSLGVSGTITAANITANTGVFTGNGSGLSALAGGNVTGQVANALVAGTVYTAAQPNITSVGTLSSLAVTGNVSAANLTGNHYGNGSTLEALNASNISSGTLAQARLANASVTLGSTALTLGSTVTTVAGLTSVTSTTFVGALTGAATTAGTVTTAAQPNITSVGTLTGLTVSATITGSVSGSAATVTTAAQPNITSVGTLTSLSSSGNIVAPNVQANTGYFISSVNAAVSAAGTVQGNATVIASMVNVVSTVASGAGVALPTAVAGMRITLINTSANALLVYPASGGAINSGATNASFSQVAGGRLDFVATSTTQWYTLNATYA